MGREGGKGWQRGGPSKALVLGGSTGREQLSKTGRHRAVMRPWAIS